MKCPECRKEMEIFGVTEKGEDKHCCDDCHIHIIGNVITHGANNKTKMSHEEIAAFHKRQSEANMPHIKAIDRLARDSFALSITKPSC